MPETYELELHDAPKSINAQSRGSHWPFTREKQKWQSMFFIALSAAKVPKGLAKVHATAVLRFPQKRRRDEGNYRAMLEKALGDALQLQWLPDDTPEHFTFGEVTFDDERGKLRTVVTLEVEHAE